MRRTTKMGIRSVIVCALLCAATSFAQASTIIKLNLGGVGPDIGMNVAGILSTTLDGNPTTNGDQNTAVEYTSFLEFIPDINSNAASFSLHGLQATGTATLFGNLMIQNYSGGNFELWSPTNTLLLSGTLTNSALTGVIGPPGTGGLFTTTLESYTGGSLTPYLTQGTLSLSMNITNVNGGNGFDVQPLTTGGTVQPFLADAAISISADFSGVPEPATMTLVGLSSAAVALGWRRRR